mgnify:CR=1 FL=1
MHRTQIILSYPEDFAEEIKKRAKAKFMKVNGYIESLITEDFNKSSLSAKINPEDRTDSPNTKENKDVKQNATKI